MLIFLAGSKRERGLCSITNSILITSDRIMWCPEIKWMERACPACGSFCSAIPDDDDDDDDDDDKRLLISASHI